jgi:aminotransferase
VLLAVSTAIGLSPEDFAQALLAAERVAVIPGPAFGPSGRVMPRACHATSRERLDEALDRIARFVDRHPAS